MLRSNYKFDEAPPGSLHHNASKYLEAVIQFEVDNRLIMMNQLNNKMCIKGFIDRDAVPDWMLTYKSVGWALLIGAWFMDFNAALFKRINDRSRTLPAVACEAYTEALAPHHNWFIRSAAWVGLNAVASRESLEASIC